MNYKGIISSLELAGFSKSSIKIDKMTALMKTEGNTMYIINAVNFQKDFMYSPYQVRSINQRLYDNMSFSSNIADVRILTLYITEETSVYREYSEIDNCNWIVSLSENRIIIYENQVYDFLNVRQVIESGFNGTGPKKKISYLNGLIIAINIITFIVLTCIGSTQNTSFMIEHGALFEPSVKLYGQYYRFVTAIFLHFGISHLANNMFVLFFVGDNLEKTVGKVKYLIIYIFSGIGGNIASYFYYIYKDELVVSAGASGSICGVIGALLYIVIRNKGNLGDITTRNLAVLVALSLYHGIKNVSADVNNVAHLGGLVAGFLLAAILYRKKESING